MKRYLFVIIPMLCGCAGPTAEQTYTPSGKPGYAISCSGRHLSWADCYKKAGETCQTKGYTVINKSTDSDFGAVANSGILAAGSKNSRSLLIQCK